MNELTNLTFDEVSVVDAGANPEADIVLIKRHKPEQNSPAPADKQETIETLKLNIADLADKVAAQLAKSISAINKEAKNMNENEKNTKPETADKQDNQGTQDVNKNSDAPTETNTAPELPAVDVDKNLPKPDAVTVTEEAIEKLNATVNDVLKRVNDMQERAELAEISKVAERYEILGVDVQELTTTLKNAKSVNKAIYDSTIATLDKALEAVKKTGLFDEIGKSGYGSGGTAQTKIEKIAAEIKKSKPELTDRQALDAAFQTHPELQY